MTKADIKLIVGMDTKLSYKSMQGSIRSIVKALNNDPPKIKIEFDNSKVKSQIKEISKLFSELSFSGEKFDFEKLHINSGDADKAASSVRKIFSETVKASQAVRLMNAEIKSVNLDRLSKGLLGKGISPDGINSIAESLTKAEVQINRVEAQLGRTSTSEQKLLGLTIEGTNKSADGLGQSVKYLIKYNQQTGEISSELVKIGQSYDSISSSASKANDITAKTVAIFKDLNGTTSNIGTQYNSLKKLLGGELATGENAAELENVRQAYLQLIEASETLKKISPMLQKQILIIFVGSRLR